MSGTQIVGQNQALPSLPFSNVDFAQVKNSLVSSVGFSNLLDKMMIEEGAYDSSSMNRDSEKDSKLDRSNQKDLQDLQRNVEGAQTTVPQHLPLFANQYQQKDVLRHETDSADKIGNSISLNIGQSDLIPIDIHPQTNTDIHTKKQFATDNSLKDIPSILKIEKMPEPASFETPDTIPFVKEQIQSFDSSKKQLMNKLDGAESDEKVKTNLFESKSKIEVPAAVEKNSTSNMIEARNLLQSAIQNKETSNTQGSDPEAKQNVLKSNTFNAVTPTSDNASIILSNSSKAGFQKDFSLSQQQEGNDFLIQGASGQGNQASKTNAFKKLMNEEAAKSTQVVYQTIQGLKKMMEQQKSNLHIQLFPQEWGAIDIQMTLHGDKASVLLMSESPETLKALVHQRQKIEKVLVDNNYNLESSNLRFALKNSQDKGYVFSDKTPDQNNDVVNIDHIINV